MSDQLIVVLERIADELQDINKHLNVISKEGLIDSQKISNSLVGIDSEILNISNAVREMAYKK